MTAGLDPIRLATPGRPQPPPFPPRARRLHRAAGVRVAGRDPAAAPRDGGRRPGHDRHRRAAADGVRLLPQRRHPGHLVAGRARGPTSSSAAPSSRWSRSRAWSRSSAAWTTRRPRAGPDGAGDHARGNGTFLTGVRLKKSATDIRAGVSIDQVIARQVGHLTRFPSLELACDAVRKSGACDSGYSCAYQYNLSWSSPTTPMPPESNPRLVFERLFGAGPPGERRANLQRRRQRAAVDPRLRPRRRPRRCSAGSARDDATEARPVPRPASARSRRASRRPSGSATVRDPAVETPAGHPAGLRGVHPAHVRHAGPGVPDRLDARRDVAARPRRQQPLVRPDRHLRGAPRPVAPPEPAGLDREGRRDRPLVRPPVRQVPGEARRRRRTSTATRCCTTR